jgi:hypothetical protein
MEQERKNYFEIGDVSKIRKDIEDLFFLTQNRVITSEECRKWFNRIRAVWLGVTEMSKEEFDSKFSTQVPAIMPKVIPQEAVSHHGQHHEVKVDVKEGEQQTLEVKEAKKE